MLHFMLRPCCSIKCSTMQQSAQHEVQHKSAEEGFCRPEAHGVRAFTPRLLPLAVRSAAVRPRICSVSARNPQFKPSFYGRCLQYPLRGARFSAGKIEADPANRFSSAIWPRSSSGSTSRGWRTNRRRSAGCSPSGRRRPRR